jgi:hypothetical protein
MVQPSQTINAPSLQSCTDCDFFTSSDDDDYQLSESQLCRKLEISFTCRGLGQEHVGSPSSSQLMPIDDPVAVTW